MKNDTKKPARKTSRAKKAPARKKTSTTAKKRAGTGARRPAAPKRRPARHKEAARAPRAPAENAAALALARKLANLVMDKKAQDVVILDVRGVASYADYVVIASGESERQVAAMADSVQSKLKAEDKVSVYGSEGQETGQWVLLDYGDVVAHLFYGDVRGHYDLEGLFADAKRESVS